MFVECFRWHCSIVEEVTPISSHRSATDIYSVFLRGATSFSFLRGEFPSGRTMVVAANFAR